MTFRKLNNHDYTDEQNISVLAEYLCQTADVSRKPESLLNLCSLLYPFTLKD